MRINTAHFWALFVVRTVPSCISPTNRRRYLTLPDYLRSIKNGSYCAYTISFKPLIWCSFYSFVQVLWTFSNIDLFHHCAYFSCSALIFSTIRLKLDIIFQSQSKGLLFSFVCHIIAYQMFRCSIALHNLQPLQD
jgi:hypothetical protein